MKPVPTANHTHYLVYLYSKIKRQEKHYIIECETTALTPNYI